MQILDAALSSILSDFADDEGVLSFLLQTRVVWENHWRSRTESAEISMTGYWGDVKLIILLRDAKLLLLMQHLYRTLYHPDFEVQA